MKIQNKHLRGFTLVEIMIVVAIIGLLASVAVPNYVKSRERTYQASCTSNLRNIDGAIQMWALEHKKDAAQSVSAADVQPYLKTPPSCPAGGTTFEDSYQLANVETLPTCKRRPDTHKLTP